jgi:hypothetical protein
MYATGVIIIIMYSAQSLSVVMKFETVVSGNQKHV